MNSCEEYLFYKQYENDDLEYLLRKDTQLWSALAILEDGKWKANTGSCRLLGFFNIDNGIRRDVTIEEVVNILFVSYL